MYREAPRPGGRGSWQGRCRSTCGQGPYCGSDSRLFLFPQFCLSPDARRGANTGLWCPHPPPSSVLGSQGGALAVTPCAWSNPRPLIQHGSSSPQPGNPTSYCPPPEKLGEHKVGQGSDPGRKGQPLPPRGKRGEHPRSLVPAAVIGTPCQSTSPPSFLTSSGFCVNCAVFILFLSFSLFTEK